MKTPFSKERQQNKLDQLRMDIIRLKIEGKMEERAKKQNYYHQLRHKWGYSK